MNAHGRIARALVLGAPLLILIGTGIPAQEPAQEFPEGVTADLIARGDSLFHGGGLCYACHGAGGTGIPGLGANLSDDEWRNSDGSFTGLIQRITEGVAAGESESGVPMPPKGGSQITDDQVQAIAAYVWSLRLP
jgi:mono/diheme cytochrome c family protein